MTARHSPLLTLESGQSGLRIYTSQRDAAPQGIHHQREAPNDLPQFRWINTLLGNLKTSFCGTFHAFNYRLAGLRL